MYQLHILTGEQAGTLRTIRKESIVIGRDDDCDVMIEEGAVSRQHAVLQVIDGQARIRDLGATNPTMLNGVEVEEALVEKGDLITIGSWAMRYVPLKEVKPFTRRTRSWFEWVVWGALACLLLTQLYVLVAVAPAWRSEVDLVAIVPTPTPTPAPTPTPRPTPEPVPVVTPPSTDAAKPTAKPLPTTAKAPEPLPTPTLGPKPTATPAPKGPPLKPRATLRQAQELIDAGRLRDADELLARLQQQEPSYIDAYELRAALFSRRTMFGESVKQWEEVIRLVGDSNPVRLEEARKELAVMKRRKAILEGDLSVLRAPAPTPVPTPTAVPRVQPLPTPVVERRSTPTARATPRPPAARLRVEAVKLERYSQNEHFDEMRMLHYSLRHLRGQPPADAARIKVHITFFDRNKVTGTIAKSRVASADSDHVVGRPLSEGSTAAFTAPYVVPRGARPGNSPETFHGYRIELYYDGILQEVTASPASLKTQK